MALRSSTPPPLPCPSRPVTAPSPTVPQGHSPRAHPLGQLQLQPSHRDPQMCASSAGVSPFETAVWLTTRCFHLGVMELLIFPHSLPIGLMAPLALVIYYSHYRGSGPKPWSHPCLLFFSSKQSGSPVGSNLLDTSGPTTSHHLRGPCPDC